MCVYVCVVSCGGGIADNCDAISVHECIVAVAAVAGVATEN